MEATVTTLLASVERCFHCVLKKTSPDGGKLRRGVVTQSKACQVMNMAQRAQGPPWPGLRSNPPFTHEIP
jgi:hypothetical protein